MKVTAKVWSIHQFFMEHCVMFHCIIWQLFFVIIFYIIEKRLGLFSVEKAHGTS